MLESTFQQAYPLALRAAQVRATAAVLSGTAQTADREDLQQDGLTACWRALPRFDPTRASLRTFIERVVAAHLASIARSARQVPAHVPLEAAGHQPVEFGFGDIEFQADMQRVFYSLHSCDRQLVLVLLEHTPTEASRLLGIPRSTLYDRIIRLRRRFIAAGFVPSGGRQ